jgi:hypothetical protein
MLAVFLLIAIHTLSQTSLPVRNLDNQNLSEVLQNYQQTLGLSIPLYNGMVHVGYSSSIAGNPYFFSTDWVIGKIQFEDITYENIQLKYDVFADQVIVKHPAGFGIILYSPRIQFFDIAGAHFIYFDGKKHNEMLPSGFYQVLANGKIELLAKRAKKINEKITSKVEQQYYDVDRHYIIKDNHAYPVGNLKSVLKLLPERKKDIKDFIKKNRYKYRRNTEFTLTKIVTFYNQEN